MTITFFSNYLNHHEIPLCEALNNMIDVDFTFVQTMKMEQERIDLGWKLEDNEISYLKVSYESTNNYEYCMNLGANSDIVIFGSAPFNFIRERVKQNKLTFYYCERLFKKSFLRAFYPPSAIEIFKRFIRPGRKSNFYALCASGYTSYDFLRISTFKNKCFRWGHFPSFYEYNPTDLLNEKQKVIPKILWAGRFLEWKHPDLPIKIAKRLKEKGIEFELEMIGTGVLENKIKALATEFKLEDVVKFSGSMRPKEVRAAMKKSNIFLFTSDFNEGWGAVLYEAMNSGCAVIASHAIGAVPLMLENNINGLMYKNGDTDDLFTKVETLLFDIDMREKLGKNAYLSVQEHWIADIAANRLYNFSKDILTKSEYKHYDRGILSKAIICNNNWFTN